MARIAEKKSLGSKKKLDCENKPMLTEKTFRRIMWQYGKAWENLDAEAIVKIFTKDATYQETPFKKPYRGHEEIKDYWKNVVKKKERDAKFFLGNIFVKDNIGIAEWKAKFIRRDNGKQEELRGIILTEVINDKIKKLWEYWHKSI